MLLSECSKLFQILTLGNAIPPFLSGDWKSVLTHMLTQAQELTQASILKHRLTN